MHLFSFHMQMMTTPSNAHLEVGMLYTYISCIHLLEGALSPPPPINNCKTHQRNVKFEHGDPNLI